MKQSLPFLIFSLCASVALAEPPAPNSGETKKAVSALVQKQLIRPMTRAQSKRSKFSRAAPPPREQRVRVLDSMTFTDARGRKYVRFAVDVRYRWDEEGDWEKNAFTGCAYPDDKKVFVRRGKDYFPAGNAVGRKGKARADVCRPSVDDVVKVASARQASGSDR